VAVIVSAALGKRSRIYGKSLKIVGVIVAAVK